MSRAQETQTFNTASGQNSGYYNQAQNSYTQAQNDVGDYQDQLAKYASSNPYVQGGQFQKTTNQILADTADAGARSAGEALQSQALRTGQNTAAPIAATERLQEEGTRTLSADEAKANAERISNQAGYQGNVLKASEVPAQLESTLSEQQARAAEGALGTQQAAGKTPGFWDEFGDSFAQSLGNTAGGGNVKINKNI